MFEKLLSHLFPVQLRESFKIDTTHGFEDSFEYHNRINRNPDFSNPSMIGGKLSANAKAQPDETRNRCLEWLNHVKSCRQCSDGTLFNLAIPGTKMCVVGQELWRLSRMGIL